MKSPWVYLFLWAMQISQRTLGDPILGESTPETGASYSKGDKVGLDIQIEVFIGDERRENTGSPNEVKPVRKDSTPKIILPKKVVVSSKNESSVIVNCSVLYADFMSWTLSTFFENSTRQKDLKSNNGASIKEKLSKGKIYGYSRRVVTEPLVINDCVKAQLILFEFGGLEQLISSISWRCLNDITCQ